MLSVISFLIPPPSIYYSWVISLWHQKALLFINQKEIFCHSHKVRNTVAFSPAQDMVQLFLKSSDLLTEQTARSQITPFPLPKKRLLSIPNSPELANFFPLLAQL